MNISISDVTLLAHAGLGVSGCMAAVWVFVETLDTRPANATRIQGIALLAAVLMAGAWICGGFWYVRFYPAEKALILRGPWPFAHNFFMETKEHLFFITGILSFLLPVATREKLYSNSAARRLVLSVAGLIAITGLAVEGAGAVIEHGAKLALLDNASKGARQ
jgi:hypothetical protein